MKSPTGFAAAAGVLCLVFSAFHSVAQEASTIEADPKAAVKTVMSSFTPNPDSPVPSTGKPLALTGSWGAQVKFPNGVPRACATARVSCAVVVYRLPENNVTCVWAVGFVPLLRKGANGQMEHVVSAMVLDENDAAALYTMKKTWSADDTAPKLITASRPVYPDLARQSNIGGVVTVQLLVGPNGQVKEAVATSGPAMLKDAVLKAVRGWTYQPLVIGSQPTSFAMVRQFTFNSRMPDVGEGYAGGTTIREQDDPHFASGFVQDGASSGSWESCTSGGCSLAAPQVPGASPH